MTTPVKSSPELSVSQASKEITVNEQARRAEQGADYYVVADKDLTAPPGSCADGACYIVGASATGTWSGQDDDLAIAVGANASNGWYFIAPREGTRAYLQDENADYRFEGSSPASWALYIPGAGSLDLDGLTDVDTAGVGDGDVLAYDANSPSGWYPKPAGGLVTFASTSDVNTGTDTGKVINSDTLAGSNFGKRIVQLQVTDPAGAALTTGDGLAYFRVPSALNGMNLVSVSATVITVSSSGLPTIQIANVTDAVDMLSTKLTIDASETDSAAATTPAVIDAAHDDVATADLLRIDCDVAGTGAKGLIVTLTFQLP